jgi:peptidoglycan/LPS O-acetylase OafA/YrhL
LILSGTSSGPWTSEAGDDRRHGTLFFNVSTGSALRADLSATAAHQHVWRPDAVGSACFLVASALAWLEVCHGWAGWRPRSWSWWITLVNLIGSVAFGVSAVAGYIDPATGQLRNAERSNLGTLIGAVCFLAGALLLLPERAGKGAAPTRPALRRLRSFLHRTLRLLSGNLP